MSTLIVTLLIWGLLAWNHFHGGVPAHYVLNDKTLPRISNWWGGIWLPLLTWVVLSRVKRRLKRRSATGAKTSQHELLPVAGLFTIGLVLGASISVAFTYNFKPFLDNSLYLVLLLCLLLPIFFGECILGFVVGMTYTFGAILPTVFILLVGLVGYILFRFVRPLLRRLFRVLRGKGALSPTR